MENEAINVSTTNSKPIAHPPRDPPICGECQALDLSFFDPTCIGCQDILRNPCTSIAEIFAIIRQWVPQTQQHIDVFICEILRRDCHIDDTDGLTNMNMLHYAAKSGALGVGDAELSAKVIQMLLSKGINIYAKCKWTDMAALHYAVYFDIPKVIEILLKASNSQDIDRNCKEFDNGTALHIACANGAYDSAEILLKHGANPHCRNRFGKLPIQCLPETIMDDSFESKAVNDIKNLLEHAMNNTESNRKHNLSLSTLQALGLELHDQVVVSGKVGILRFCGSTEFASGQWAGIELQDPIGKNDGSVAGIRYFTCKPKYGIFAPITKVKKYESSDNNMTIESISSSFSNSSRASPTNLLKIGDRVLVAGQKKGFVKYIGPTKFSSGSWVGVELDTMSGKNDGSVAGVRYFQCQPKHGVFAPSSRVKKISIDDLEDESSNETTEKPKKSSNSTKENKSIQNTSNLSTQSKKTSPKMDRTLGAQLNFTLKTGMSVYTNNELGILRFVGRVDFAEDVWLGIELRKPNGKNDGSVEGKRYFTCKPKHGLMVRPNRATCRGINCAQLIDLNLY